MSAHAVTKWIYISLSYGFCDPVYGHVRPANKLLLWSNLQPGQTQKQSALSKAVRWALCPRLSFSCQVSGVQYIH